MKKLLILSLVLVSFTTSACSTNFKAMSEDLRDQNLDTTVNFAQSKNVRTPYAQVTHTGGGGSLIGLLVIAAVDTAINISAAQSARSRKQAIAKGISKIDFDAVVKRPTIQAMKAAPWMSVKEVNQYSSSVENKSAIESAKTNYVASVSYDFAAISDVMLQGTLSFKLFSKESPESEIYKFVEIEQYTIPGAEPFDGKEQIGEWEDNEGELIQAAVKATTQNLIEKMKIYLSDPFDKQAKAKINNYAQSAPGQE